MFFTVLPGTELWKANFNSTHHLGTWKGLFDAKGHMHGRRNVLYFWTSCRIEERKKSTKANFNSSSGLSRPFTSDSLLSIFIWPPFYFCARASRTGSHASPLPWTHSNHLELSFLPWKSSYPILPFLFIFFCGVWFLYHEFVSFIIFIKLII